ncbi:MAG TPA: hypothetical protein DCP85_11135 [Elusimicrobia bacterium]|nr:hypothetical protein [Elusimicrobiota bacterium]
MVKEDAMGSAARRGAAAALAALGLLAPVGAAGRAVHDLCPGVRFVGADPGLNEVEKRLVCGDPDSEGWKRVSLPQAKGFLRAFLQRRGYGLATFQSEDRLLVVDIGTPTVVGKFTGSGIDGIFDLGKRSGFVGNLLTPALLDKAQKAVLWELQSRGYACPRVAVTGDARTGEVHVDVDPGGIYRFSEIPPAPIPGIDPAVLDRFRAFVYGKPFDIRLLSLTAERLKQEELFMNAAYEVACGTDGPRVTQHVVSAPPRLVTIGVGADTEGLVRGRARFQHSRIGYRASSAELELSASRLEQALSGSMRVYLRPADRLHLVPAAFLRREDDAPYSAAHAQASLGPAWTRDFSGFSLELRGGPAVEYFNTLTGLGPSRARWLGLQTRALARSHEHEYYQRDPRQGWSFTLETASRLAGAYSSISVHRLRLGAEALWNLGRFDPAVAIFAARGFLTTTWIAQPAAAFTRLPPSDRTFFGGEADLRGLGRKQLPGDRTGFLTAVYDGLELRAGELLPYNFQPLAFIDAAMGGVRDFHLDPDVYYSPGCGLRWPSPVGTFRLTLARGLAWRRGSLTAPPTPRWQFFLGYGKEF